MALGLAMVPECAKAGKILDFSFNGSGTEEASGRGASDTLKLMLLDSRKMEVDLHSEDGGGVSGKPGDKALNLTSAEGMGAVVDGPEVKGPVAKGERQTDALSSMVSYTVQGWFKTDGDPIRGVARLIDCTMDGVSAPLLAIWSTVSPGTIYFTVSNPEVDSGSKAPASKYSAFKQQNEWVFFAITYSQDNGAIHFYTGGSERSVSSINSVVAHAKTSDISCTPYIGNTRGFNRPFKGFIDNLRIFGSKTDDSGALSIEALEELRTKDIGG
ncbi:MAG: LamG-like jellyroll fold domain-containing protein [Verrucomicrobiae bacterium]